MLIPLIGGVFKIYFAMIFVYILLSWLPQVRESPLGVVLGKMVEPYLGIFRQFIPPIGMIDLSPLVAIIALQFIEEGVKVVVALLQTSLS